MTPSSELSARSRASNVKLRCSRGSSATPPRKRARRARDPGVNGARADDPCARHDEGKGERPSMNDDRDVLERFGPLFPPPSDSYEQLLQSCAYRKRRNRRIGALALASFITIILLGSLLTASIGSRQRPPRPEPAIHPTLVGSFNMSWMGKYGRRSCERDRPRGAHRDGQLSLRRLERRCETLLVRAGLRGARRTV